MKTKDLIKALQHLNPEAEVKINIMQSNRAYGVVQLPIEYGSGKEEFDETKDGPQYYLHTWVNNKYGGSITVWLPDGAYISKLPKEF
jgi:hypothetical protein